MSGTIPPAGEGPAKPENSRSALPLDGFDLLVNHTPMIHTSSNSPGHGLSEHTIEIPTQLPYGKIEFEGGDPVCGLGPPQFCDLSDVAKVEVRP